MAVVVVHGLTAAGVTGTLKPDESVVIAWDGSNGFGDTGPTLNIFEDHRNSTAGSDLSTTATIGTWTAHESGSGIKAQGSADLPRSGTVCGQYWKTSSSDVNSKSTLYFGGGKTEVMVVFSFRLPSPSPWPGEITAGTYPDSSTWKMSWLIASNVSTESWDASTALDGRADLTMPAYSDDDFIGLLGNESSNGILNWFSGNKPSEFHSFNSWSRFAIWVREVDGVNDNAYLQSIGPLGNVTKTENTDSLLGNPWTGDVGEDIFRSIIFPGFVGNLAGGSPTVLYDDIYVATGAGSAARVEIGNNATYDSCTDLAICTPTAWANEELTVTLRSGAFPTFNGGFIHIHDLNNAEVGTSRLIS